ncbi:hypothetical protein [Hymenobacter guriensis]|uniref:Protein BatD n=1 Tax=Hymenobacter guriensis TaxID=2793065 RepID=A0ABS0KVU9_9BACT|nr:hypothetical protein [Hymenobacter guriensis]MBG8551989.1 hypothetical protein [Hymenobacter guriensis]
MGSRWVARLGLALLPLVALAQQPEPVGRFRQPTTQVGDVVEFELTFRHPAALEVVFPDSTADFRPFEYVGRRYSPTRTLQGQSLDRAVYRLRTFALDSVQQLSLPVMVLRGRDSVLLPTAPAAVRLRFLAPAATASPPALRATTTLLPVEARFNYPYWLTALGGLMVLSGGLVLLFRRRLRRRYQRYKLRKNHAYFLAQYARHIERFELSRSATNMERAITLWKNYLTRLEDSNLNSLTTREVEAHYQHHPAMSSALRVADRVVYGNLLAEDETPEIDQAFAQLREFAEQRYQLAGARVQAA